MGGGIIVADTQRVGVFSRQATDAQSLSLSCTHSLAGRGKSRRAWTVQDPFVSALARAYLRAESSDGRLVRLGYISGSVWP